jgi:hypothetical protein
MDTDQNISNSQAANIQTADNNSNSKRKVNKKIILAILGFSIGLIIIISVVWFLFFKDSMVLKEYSNSDFKILVPESGYSIDGDYSISSTDRQLVWSANSENSNKQGYIKIKRVDLGDNYSHEDILGLIDKDYSLNEQSLPRAAVIGVEDFSEFKYDKIKFDDSDERKVSFSVNSSGKLSYKEHRYYKIKNHTIIVLLLKYGVDNKELTNNVEKIEKSFTISI